MNKYYRVRSQEEFNWLMKKLEDKGCTWSGDIKPTEFLDTWGIYGDETVVYREGALGHSGLKYFEEEYADLSLLTEVSELMKESLSENTDLNPIKPAHYRTGEIDKYEAWYRQLPFNEYKSVMRAIAERYLWRDKENTLEDLDKAIYTIKRLKEKVEEEN